MSSTTSSESLPVATKAAVKTVALIGNPNTGKSTLFNALSGMKVRTGNYPGVTVEKKIARVVWKERPLDLVDLPGTYSLSPRSLDERVSVDVLLGNQASLSKVDAVVCIVDASNLERNLYLVSQILDLGLPTVLILNMSDLAASKGIAIDAAKLSERLGIPVVATEAHRKKQLEEVRTAILNAADQPPRIPETLFPDLFYEQAGVLRETIRSHKNRDLPQFLTQRLLLDRGGQIEEELCDSSEAGQKIATQLEQCREKLAAENCRVPAVEARLRYAWARKSLDGIVVHPAERKPTFSDRLDKLLTHRVIGLCVFAALMFLVFQTIYTWAGPLMDLVEAGQGEIADAVSAQIAPGMLRSLIVDGIIAGVGGVLIFVPQICLLFLFLAILEDCGYMSRAAFLMDRLMSRLGLSGKSFVPLMSSFACAIPGVMATRVIEHRRDRMLTMLVAPLMSCSARLPVYLLLIAAFIPAQTLLGGIIELQGLVLFLMYCLGAFVAIPVVWILKKLFFPGETPPFVMELPDYKIPSVRVVAERVYDRGKAFVVRAGTLIFATSVLVWAAGYFPEDHTRQHELQAQMEKVESVLEEETAKIEDAQFALDVIAKIKSDNEGSRAARRELEEGVSPAVRRELEERAGIPADLPASEVISEENIATQNQRMEEHTAEVEILEAQLEPLREEHNQVSAQLIADSYLGQMGHAIEPAVKPLGWDWKIGVGAIASFPAREVIISTLGTIYSLGGDVDEEDEGLIGSLRSAQWPDGRKVFNVPVALSVMVFFALCAQCAATLMVMKRETNSWRWPLFTFAYMTGLAYVGAFITYQVGKLWL